MKNLTDFACLLCLVIGYHAAPILCHPGQSKLDPDSTRLGDRRLQPVPLHADPVASVPVDDGLESSTHVEARSLRAAAASFDRLRARGQERQCEPLKASPGGDPRCYIITKLELGLKLSDGTGDIIGARLDSTAGDTAFDIVSGPSAGFQGWKTVDWTRSFSRNEIVIGSINKLYLTAEGRMGTPPPWNDAFKVQDLRLRAHCKSGAKAVYNKLIGLNEEYHHPSLYKIDPMNFLKRKDVASFDIHPREWLVLSD